MTASREREAYDAGRLAGYEEGLAAREEPDLPTQLENAVDLLVTAAGALRVLDAQLPAEPIEPAGTLDVDLVRLAGFRDRLLIRDADQPHGVIRELNPEEWATLIRASVALLADSEPSS